MDTWPPSILYPAWLASLGGAFVIGIVIAKIKTRSRPPQQNFFDKISRAQDFIERAVWIQLGVNAIFFLFDNYPRRWIVAYSTLGAALGYWFLAGVWHMGVRLARSRGS